MKAILLLSLLVVLALSRNYPLYKQCDSRWGSNKIGTSSKTICQVGCCMSSAAMALAGTGHNYNPGTLNSWLVKNGGYASGDLLVWTALNKLGLSYKGKVANSAIKSNLDAGHVVICNVHGGAHWVLAHSYKGDTIYVNDPGYSTTSYTLSQIVSGHNAVYTTSHMPTWFNYYFYTAQEALYEMLGIEYDVVAQDQIPHNDATPEVIVA